MCIEKYIPLVIKWGEEGDVIKILYKLFQLDYSITVT